MIRGIAEMVCQVFFRGSQLPRGALMRRRECLPSAFLMREREPRGRECPTEASEPGVRGFLAPKKHCAPGPCRLIVSARV